MDGRFVALVGNLSEGFRVIGPFDSFDEASSHTEGMGESWITALENPNPVKRYRVVRFYRDSDEREILGGGLTLSEAQAICRHPETSSKTATGEGAQAITDAKGPWFCGYEEE